MGVNFWGVVHGCRAFLPHLVGGGHIVNTASIAGLMPGFGPSYDASKHAVVAISENLFHTVQGGRAAHRRQRAVPRLGAHEHHRGRPQLAERAGREAGRRPGQRRRSASTSTRALAEGRTPASVADAVADAITADRFWVIPHQDFLDIAIARWETIGEQVDPRAAPSTIPGMPPRSQMIAEVMAALGIERASLTDGGAGRP